jgi:hypothetical protein
MVWFWIIEKDLMHGNDYKLRMQLSRQTLVKSRILKANSKNHVEVVELSI